MRETVKASHDGPIRIAARQVPGEWIDYNGHMNVAYYTMAFDNALDVVLDDHLGVGERQAREARMGPMALQTQIHYLGELLEGDCFVVDFQLLDADAKRMHFFMTMWRVGADSPAATYESLSINVDLDARRSAPYPDEARQRIDRLLTAHARLPRPDLAGRTIGIRRPGAPG